MCYHKSKESSPPKNAFERDPKETDLNCFCALPFPLLCEAGCDVWMRMVFSTTMSKLIRLGAHPVAAL
eukprot:4435976-Amphidinium_carterae.1